MSDNTKIEWADATVNAINGCSVTSPGCTNCYAMRLAGTSMQHHPTRAGLTQPSKAGPVWTGEVRLNEAALLQPLSWKRPRRIFWNAHGDTFHDAVPDEWIDRVFAVCALTPQHTHMILTKRSAQMRDYCRNDRATGRIARVILDWLLDKVITFVEPWPVRSIGDIDNPIDLALNSWPLPNVWLGVSVEDQARADERIVDLAQTPASVRFISGEPLLSGLSLTDIPLNGGPDEHGVQWLFNALTGDQYFIGDDGHNYGGDGPDMQPLDWVIAGGESGPNARPMHPDWARSLRNQCAAAGIAFHFKQWGEWAPGEAFGMHSDRAITDRFGNVRDWMRRYVVCADRADRLTAHTFTGHSTDLVYRVGKARAGRLLDGRKHDEFPA